MNYCDKITYHLYTTEEAPFHEMAGRLLNCLPADEAPLRLAFFGTQATNEEYTERKESLSAMISKRYDGCEPAYSYISQPPLNASLMLEVCSYKPDAADALSYRKYAGMPYVVLENPQGRFLFAGGFQGEVAAQTAEQQSAAVFRLIGDLLKKERFPVNSIIRQWNYIEQITRFDGCGQHYQSFNNARSDFYATTDWTNGYPAATGIGADRGGILVDLDAATFTAPDAYATPIDNNLQVAAHAYSGQVLEMAGEKKTTPKFERAKSMTFGRRTFIYISGTAAIRGEESLKGVGLERQLRITMENISQLTGGLRPAFLRVYLKYKDDYAQAARLMESYGWDIPVSYVQADVCRDELLIEIEGIAIR